MGAQEDGLRCGTPHPHIFLASFPGPAQLSVACSRNAGGGAWNKAISFSHYSLDSACFFNNNWQKGMDVALSQAIFLLPHSLGKVVYMDTRLATT